MRFRAGAPSFLTEGAAADCELRGFEIHMGHLHPRRPRTRTPHGTLLPATPAATTPYVPTFVIASRNGEAAEARDGAVNADGSVVGTMVHGLFDNAPVMTSMLDHLRQRRGLPVRGASVVDSRESGYQRLADAARAFLDGPLLRRIAGLG